jgi:hypothetical protein
MAGGACCLPKAHVLTTVRLPGRLPAQDTSPEVQARLQHLRATGPTHVVLPFGVTLIARGWHDEFLWRVRCWRCRGCPGGAGAAEAAAVGAATCSHPAGRAPPMGGAPLPARLPLLTSAADAAAAYPAAAGGRGHAGGCGPGLRAQGPRSGAGGAARDAGQRPPLRQQGRAGAHHSGAGQLRGSGGLPVEEYCAEGGLCMPQAGRLAADEFPRDKPANDKRGV